jgi:hypothetical protein
LCPDEAVYNQLYESLDSIEEPPVDPSALVGDIASKARPTAPTVETVTSVIRGAMEGKSSDKNDPTLLLAKNLKQMVLPTNNHFFGKSSGAMLIRTAFELKKEYRGDEGRSGGQVKAAVNTKRTEFWDAKPVR